MNQYKSVLTNCFESAYQRFDGKGIYLFPIPTGAGKSFTAAEYAVHAWNRGERIWVVTANRNNVASVVNDAVEKAHLFLSEDDADAFEKQLIHLKNNESIWRGNLLRIEKSEVEYLGKAAADIFEEMCKNERERTFYEKSLRSVQTSREEIKGGIDFMKEKYSEAFGQLESDFRKILKRDITKCIGRNKSGDNLWGYLDEHPWIKKVYPFAEVARADENGRVPPVFCSVAKTAYVCDDLRGASEYLYVLISRLGGTVIMDEIDQSKDAYKAAILNQNIPYNAYNVSNRIMHGFTPENLADVIKCGTDEADIERLQQFAEDMKRQGEALHKSFNIGTLRRELPRDFLDQMEKNSNYILSTAYYSFSGSPMYQNVSDTGALILGFEETEDSKNLKIVFGALNGYNKRWRAGSSYFLRALAKKNWKPNMYEDSNLSSYLKLLGFEASTSEYKYAKALLKQKRNSAHYPVNSLYSEGMVLSIPYFDNDDTERNTMVTVGFSTTPEEILCNLASSCFVIGLSATADCKTVLSNYNYDWIREQGICVEVPNAEEWEYVRRRQAQRFKEKSEFRYEAIPVFDLIGDLAREEPNECIPILELINKQTMLIKEARENETSRDYYFNQIRNITSAMMYFALEESHKAGLIYTKRDYGRIAETIAETILPELGRKVTVLCAVADNLEEKTKKAHELLRSGERVIICCPFETAMQAWNFNYPLGKEDKDIIEITDEGADTVDFDYLYIGDLTQILPKAQNKKEDWEKAKIEELYVVQDIYEAGEISKSERERWNRSYMSGRSIPVKEQKFLQSYQYRILTVLVQTIGRLERSRFKRLMTLVQYDPSYLEKINAACVEEFLQEHVLNPITEHALRSIAEKAMSVSMEKTIDENLMSKRSTYVGREIHNKFGRRSEDNPYRYETMLDRRGYCAFTLCCPSPEESDFDRKDAISRQYYLEWDGPLYYKAENDFRTISIRTTPAAGYRLISEDETLLPNIMRNEEVKEGFEKYGYATSWKESRYKMSPALMNNIYKGEIGERAARILLENRGFPIVEIEDHTIYEECDFLCRGIAIDAKNMHPDKYDDSGLCAGYESHEKLRHAIDGKMKRLGKDKFIIVNTICNGSHRYREEHLDNGTVYIIPGLIDIESGNIVEENMQMLLSILGGFYD